MKHQGDGAARSNKPKKATQRKGLLLDDFLGEIRYAPKYFGVHRRSLNSQRFAAYPGARRAMEKIIRATVEWQRGEVYAQSDSLLAKLGKGIYGDPLSKRPLRFQIAPQFLEAVLQRVLQLGLETIVCLPQSDEKPYTAKEFKASAKTLRKAAERVRATDRRAGVRERIGCLPQPASGHKPELWTLAGEMLQAADMLEAAGKLKIRRRTGSPNPQVRLALYVATFIEACTGQQHYARLKTLLAASFHSIGKDTVPKWVERLEVEMTLQRKCRAKLH